MRIPRITITLPPKEDNDGVVEQKPRIVTIDTDVAKEKVDHAKQGVVDGTKATGKAFANVGRRFKEAGSVLVARNNEDVEDETNDSPTEQLALTTGNDS